MQQPAHTGMRGNPYATAAPAMEMSPPKYDAHASAAPPAYTDPAQASAPTYTQAAPMYSAQPVYAQPQYGQPQQQQFVNGIPVVSQAPPGAVQVQAQAVQPGQWGQPQPNAYAQQAYRGNLPNGMGRAAFAAGGTMSFRKPNGGRNPAGFCVMICFVPIFWLAFGGGGLAIKSLGSNQLEEAQALEPEEEVRCERERHNRPGDFLAPICAACRLSLPDGFLRPPTVSVPLPFVESFVANS